MYAYRLSGDREPEAKTGSIASASLAKGPEDVLFRVWKTTAFVLDLDDEAVAIRPCPEHHVAAWTRVLERVVQQVHHR